MELVITCASVQRGSVLHVAGRCNAQKVQKLKTQLWGSGLWKSYWGAFWKRFKISSQENGDPVQHIPKLNKLRDSRLRTWFAQWRRMRTGIGNGSIKCIQFNLRIFGTKASTWANAMGFIKDCVDDFIHKPMIFCELLFNFDKLLRVTDGDLMMEEDVVREKEERTKSLCNRTDLSQTVTNPLPFRSTTIVLPIPSSQPFPFGQALKFLLWYQEW